ncbi:hypothetical protein ACP6DX_24760, partial [Klebsiella pneumoniae subsp. pneumoniae]
LDITFTRLRAVRREGVNEHGPVQMSGFQFLRSAVAATWSDVPRSAVCLNLREEKSSGSSKE